MTLTKLVLYLDSWTAVKLVIKLAVALANCLSVCQDSRFIDKLDRK